MFCHGHVLETLGRALDVRGGHLMQHMGKEALKMESTYALGPPKILGLEGSMREGNGHTGQLEAEGGCVLCLQEGRAFTPCHSGWWGTLFGEGADSRAGQLRS